MSYTPTAYIAILPKHTTLNNNDKYFIKIDHLPADPWWGRVGWWCIVEYRSWYPGPPWLDLLQPLNVGKTPPDRTPAERKAKDMVLMHFKYQHSVQKKYHNSTGKCYMKSAHSPLTERLQTAHQEKTWKVNPADCFSTYRRNRRNIRANLGLELPARHLLSVLNVL